MARSSMDVMLAADVSPARLPAQAIRGMGGFVVFMVLLCFYL